MSLRVSALLVSGAAMIASAALAQPAPTWVQAPSVADLAAAYPAKAKAAGIGGRVNLTCEIKEGRPRECAALGEEPSGYGFGPAARKLAERMQVSDPGLNGQEVRVPFTFDPAVLKGEAPLVTLPVWAALPAVADFQATFPKTENGVNSVLVVLACSVEAGGSLSGCTVDREEPAGQGYGQGALVLAPKFKVGPWSQDGKPTAGARLRVPIRYELTQAPPPKG